MNPLDTRIPKSKVELFIKIVRIMQTKLGTLEKVAEKANLNTSTIEAVIYKDVITVRTARKLVRANEKLLNKEK